MHLDLADGEGFAHSCVQGKELGFDGKTLIHPKTIAKANEVFAPSPDEVAWSRKIIAAHAEASRAGKGITVVDGKLIENLHVESAKRLVALTEAATHGHGSIVLLVDEIDRRELKNFWPQRFSTALGYWSVEVPVSERPLVSAGCLKLTSTFQRSELFSGEVREEQPQPSVPLVEPPCSPNG